ncbi:TPA: hypothetical protein ACF2DR_002104 [Clostridium perfringens]|uniref:hypothetical protein n=1 Tax=Clostridium perfringens TaxID=1502 RepID=UPI0009D7163B|nr:hypothetical protein [Clostridium perfringens]
MDNVDNIYKEYRTVRIARETKFWLNELINFKENKLKEIKNNLIKSHEIELRKNPDFSDGYSPTISVAVTSGSILEAAYNYTQKADINWNELFNEIEKAKNDIDKTLDVGTLTPRFYLYSSVWDALEEYRAKLKPAEMQRNLMLNYVIKLVIFAYYKNIFNIK